MSTFFAPVALSTRSTFSATSPTMAFKSPTPKNPGAIMSP